MLAMCMALVGWAQGIAATATAHTSEMTDYGSALSKGHHVTLCLPAIEAV